MRDSAALGNRAAEQERSSERTRVALSVVLVVGVGAVGGALASAQAAHAGTGSLGAIAVTAVAYSVLLLAGLGVSILRFNLLAFGFAVTAGTIWLLNSDFLAAMGPIRWVWESEQFAGIGSVLELFFGS